MNILKSKLVPTGALNNTKKTAIVLTAVMGSSSAMAAGEGGGLPAAATAAMGQVSALAQSMVDLAWPIVITITLAVIGISLFKKFSKKSVS
ncbi:major coat protein [Aliivibrio fischeri]|uniref:Phage coat protein n=1 Tax=Aliivibrio fischeri TaxID=668 RepID=A0A844P8K9_ALIFS|nr:major coat protein [Aliivibrio fischeri]MUK51437.1 phage coat protein [Aliivibrio fischeri]